MLHLACQVVCPGVLLLGEVVMEPAKVAPYFGTQEKPECHILYNVTTMCTTWHTVATRDVRLLKRQLEQVCALPRDYLFQNYLRCHDDIGWGLDYPWLRQFAMEEVAHKKYLNDWFTGKWPGSWSRGELYNDDPKLGDARLCGTTASLCGMEKAGFKEQKRALDCDVMLHAWMLTQSGIPVLYSGDEVAQLNDYTYHDDPDKQADSRYLHRGKFDWAAAERRHNRRTRQGKVFSALRKLETIRAAEPAFRADAEVHSLQTGSDQVLGVVRIWEQEQVVALFNFSEVPQVISLCRKTFTDLMTGKPVEPDRLELPAYGFLWAKREGD